MDLFGTAGIRGDVRTAVTPELAVAVGRAAARDATEVVIGRDGRTTGGALAAVIILVAVAVSVLIFFLT